MNQKINVIDYNLVPETLEWCRKHYVPPIKEHIHCPSFGRCDGTDGSCWWCGEMTPYQHEMCRDETWVKSLMSPLAHIRANSREEAAEFIERYKQSN